MNELSGAHRALEACGKLGSRPLALLLADARDRATTGTLTVRAPRGRFAVITLRDGQVAGVRTSDPVAFLGGVLYELGVIDTATLDATLLEVARSGRLHGEILLERGDVTAEELAEALAEQTTRKLSHVFSFPDEATWELSIGEDDLAKQRDDGRPSVEPWVGIWRGLCEHPPVEHVQAALAELDAVHVRDARVLDALGLSNDERAVGEQLAAQAARVDRLVMTSPLSAERTRLLVYFLVLARAVVRVATRAIGPLELGAEGVRARARDIASEDPYMALGVQAGAPVEAARAAFLRLARLWHPDRIPRELDEVRAECAQVFASMVDAHRALTERARHRSLGGFAAHAAPRAPATSLGDIDRALDRSDFASAEALAKALAKSGHEGPAARAVLAWCRAKGGAAERAALVRAASELDALLAGDPECERALLYRGRVNKRLGNAEAAVRDFRKLARLDPKQLEAAREVRLFEMRAQKLAATTPRGSDAPNAARSGLRRLFGRIAT